MRDNEITYGDVPPTWGETESEPYAESVVIALGWNCLEFRLAVIKQCFKSPPSSCCTQVSGSMDAAGGLLLLGCTRRVRDLATRQFTIHTIIEEILL